MSLSDIQKKFAIGQIYTIYLSNNDGKRKNKWGPFFATFAVLGMSVSRIFFKNMVERRGTKVACILSLFISFIFLIGILNIFKYKYLMEHKELLEGLGMDIKE